MLQDLGVDEKTVCSVTGDVYPESGTKRRSAASSSASILSPQITSQASHSASKRRNIWENTLDVRPPQDDSEGRRYWEYRNVYHIPVPPGIEYWEDEDRKRWEMTNIGGLNESEANRQIKAARAQELARTRQMIQPITPQATHITFTLSLICFGLQISLAMIALILSIYQIIYHSQLHSGLVFLLLALIPLTGGACGIFSTMMKSQTFTLTTAIYDVASAVGVAVAAINVYSFKIDEQKPLVGFLPLAFAIALVQLASFGIVLIIYIDMLTSGSYYSGCTVLFSSFYFIFQYTYSLL
uniref:MgtE domain-containing protein n=1 Tax=Elaeophora elaphi TaxID=1147741 RepID=A0A0R3RYY3_9BILA